MPDDLLTPVIESILARSTAASGKAVFVDPVILHSLLYPLVSEMERLTDALKNIEAAHLLLRAEVERAVKWGYQDGLNAMDNYGCWDTEDAAWSRYQQERKGEGHE